MQVFYNQTWGMVCDDGFDKNSATVLCRMMGFDSGVVNDTYKQGQGQVCPSVPIWLDSVQCTGNEAHIDDCFHEPYGEHNCVHSEDVAVRCYGISFIIVIYINIAAQNHIHCTLSPLIVQGGTSRVEFQACMNNREGEKDKKS